jgi:hypothetical protein
MTLERRTPLRRRTGIRSRRPTPRRLPETSCVGRTARGTACRGRIYFDRWCFRHAVKEADRLFSLVIRRRDRRCQICPTDRDLQAAHLASRGYYAVRWAEENAVALCRADHKRMTHAPLEWDVWVAERLGADVWDALKRRARAGGMPDLGWTILGLRRRLEVLDG